MADLRRAKISPWLWAITGAAILTAGLYLIQAWGMQDFLGPWYFFQDKWYFILPLILAFAVQLGLFRAINLKVRQSPATVAATGGVSLTSMIACCTHNLVTFIPVLGLTALAAALNQYQDYIFGFSLVFALGGVVYLGRQYRRLNLNLTCH